MPPNTGPSLHVWMNGELVGNWKVSRGIHHFTYAESWYDFPGRRPVSLSLPLQYFGYKHTGDVVENYFDNLLPDNFEIKKRLQARFRTPTAKTFDLLYEIGRDCIGAVQLLPPEFEVPDVRTVDGKAVTDNEIENILKSVTSNSAFSKLEQDEFRISLAGTQEKTALTRYKGKWLKSIGTSPSTHIFKLPLGHIGQNQLDLSSSIENEWLCARIFKQFDLPTANSEIAHYGTEKTLIVERFDRKLTDKEWFVRIPQEDFCQVMGLSSGLKYENDGGPGIKKIMDVLLGSKNAESDRNIFFTAQMLFWLLAAPDGHAKNFSVFIEPHGTYRLTPFYDIMSAFPVLGTSSNRIPAAKLKMAMAFMGKNRHYKWNAITYRHVIETGKICGLTKARTDALLDNILQTAAQSIDNVTSLLPAGFPSKTAELIFEGFLSSVRKMKD